jgi:hypothetical protein
METVHGGLELELNPPYLMYTHGDDEVRPLSPRRCVLLPPPPSTPRQLQLCTHVSSPELLHLCPPICRQIHGIWFYDPADLDSLGKILKKIVDQLPKPATPGDPSAPPAGAPAPAAPAPAAPLPPAASAGSEVAGGGGGGGGGGGDAFWDRSVHVTEDTLGAQRLVPNETLLRDTATSGAGEAAPPPRPAAGLQMLLKQAHQSFQGQRAGPPAAPGGAPAAVRTGGEAPAAGPQLLTPSFFAQQAAAAAAPAPQQQPAAQAPAAPPSAAGSASLQQMLNSAARKAGTATPSLGLAGSMALPPGAPPQPQQLQVRERLRGALARLVANDAFVDMLATELRASGLLH